MLDSLSPFLARLASSSSTKEAAIADNSRFDERAHVQRWEQFADFLPTDDHLDLSFGDWSEAANLHYQKRVTVPSVSVPDALLDINRHAWLFGLAPEQTLVRLETLDWPLSLGNLDFKTLQNLLDTWEKQADSAQALASFLDEWNRARDNRPLFAAFLDEVREDAERDDWPHLLRDRLGLGHYSPKPGAPIPVALMRYPLRDVIATQKARKLPSACALPTVLDGGMHEYFFPVPEQNPYGATLHLAPGQSDLLTAEIIHCRLDYQSRHLWKLGWIRSPHALAEGHDTASEAARQERLRTARDLHLLQLRIDSGREDFAEEMEGR